MNDRTAPERQIGERAHRLGLLVNTLLAVVKILGGSLSRSPALMADGLHSLGDIGVGGVAWLSFRWSARPADEDHHYGHGKAEAAAGLFVGLVLLVGGVLVLLDALAADAPSYVGIQGIVALSVAVVSVAANEWLVSVTKRAARELSSQTLAALARDNRSDSLSSLLVILGVGFNLTGWPIAENIAAAVIGLLISTMGIKSGKEALDVLMDRVPDTSLRERLQSLASGVPGVQGVQRVDIHPLGADMRVDMEISVDGELPVRKGHAIAHEVESVVTREVSRIVEVAVHVNPA